MVSICDSGDEAIWREIGDPAGVLGLLYRSTIVL